MSRVNEKLIRELKIEQEKKIIDYQKKTGHARPSSRREFLGSGLLGFSGYMIAPSFLEMFLNATTAMAADCGTAAAAGTGLMPFVTINLSGGWGGSANWLPKDIGGQLLPSYSQIGSGKVPANTATAFANSALFSTSANTAGFLSGVKTAATAATIAKTSFVGMPVSSGDDTSNDKFDIGGLLAAAGLKGQKLPNMGTGNSATGINMQPALGKLPPAPLRVGSIKDVLNALGTAGTLAAGLSATQQKSIMLSLFKTVKNLSDSQARSLASLSGGTEVADLVGCSTQKNVENITAGAGSVDPRTNASLAANATTAVAGADGTPLWNFANAGELTRSAMTMNALSGLAGAIGMEMGGYDYHGDSRANTDAKDKAAGRLVGQILESASKLSKPVFIYIVSDGSVNYTTSDNAGTGATGDSGNRGVVLMLAFNPAGAPKAKSSQIGGFTTGQVANSSFMPGWNADKAAAAAFVNWAQLNKDTGLIQKVIPNVFSATELNLVNMFG